MNFLNFYILLTPFFLSLLSPALGKNSENSSGCLPPEPIVSIISTLPIDYSSDITRIIGSANGKIILSSSSHIWLFDGLNWEPLVEPDDVYPSETTNDRIYFRSNGRLHILNQTSEGLFSSIFEQDIDDKEKLLNFTNLVVGAKATVFQTFIKHQKHYLSRNESIIDSSTNSIHIVGCKNNLFYYKEKEGIFHLNTEGKIPTKIPNTAKLANKSLQLVHETSDLLFAVTSNYPWFHFLNGTDEKMKGNLIKIIGSTQNRIIRAFYRNNSIVIIIENAGVIVLNERMEVISNIAAVSQNYLNQAIDVLPLSESTLLILTKTSLLRVFSPSIAGFYGNRHGFVSYANDILYKDRKVYYATNSGVLISNYRANKPNEHCFENIRGIDERVESLIEFRGKIYAAGAKGIFIIDGKSAERIGFNNNLKEAKSLLFSKTDENLWLLVNLYDSILVANLMQRPINFYEIPKPAPTFQVEKVYASSGSMIVANNHKDIFETNLELPFKGWTKSDYFPNEHKKIAQDSTCNLVPIYQTNSKTIVKRRNKQFPDLYSLWFYNYNALEDGYTPVRFAACLPSIEVLHSSTILPDSTLLLSTTSGLYYFSNSSHLSNALKPYVSIFKASLENKRNKEYLKNGYLFKSETESLPHVSAINRNLNIVLTSIGCSEWGFGHSNVQYSTFLSGYDSEWSSWTNINIREYSYLEPGNYQFMVKVRNFIGEESDIETLSFTILPKFYQTKVFYLSFLLIGFFGALMITQWRRYYHAKVRFKLESLINMRTEELVREKEKTENLLARVLPKDTAAELKEKGKVNTQRFQVVTVLFCDIEGFTRITDETNPEALIDQLDRFFLYFDSVVEKYRIEKIKTIGDAYMCAGGIPEKNRTNPIEVVLAALEMMQYMKHITTSGSGKTNVWELRIGVDTGPVIAGVVGRNKLSYDIWGSTVNTASRMESSGEVGHINISGNTYMLVKDYFICTFRGKMPVKNKGDIQMYFVNGIKPSLSEGMKGLVPNYEFQTQLQLVRLGDLEDLILEKLEKGLPKNLYYHNLKHTVDVYTQVELIGRSENVTKEELLLLRTAALFHDAGHLIDYDTHEEMAVKLAREVLPQYQYNDHQINIVSQLIMATKMPPKPKNLLEEIMCDADLDYLGRPDFIPVSNNLYRELHEHGKIGTQREWNELQIKFIDKHFYFTKTARKLRNVNKQSQLEKLKSWLEKN